MKKFLLLCFVLPLGSCITSTENVSITYSSNVGAIGKPTNEIIEKKDTKFVSKDECYETLKPLIDKGMPVKPNVTNVTNIDQTLLESIQEHRKYIKELTDKIRSCHH